MSKKGGKRKSLEQRAPSGRIVQKYAPMADAKEAMSVAVEARARQFGVSIPEAADMRETSYLGELRRLGQQGNGISLQQYMTANAYLRHTQLYDGLHPQRGYPEAANLMRGGGYDGSSGEEPEYVAMFKRVSLKEREVEQALFEANREDFRARDALKHIVIEDWRQPHLVGSLRTALNHLAPVFHVTEYDDDKEGQRHRALTSAIFQA